MRELRDLAAVPRWGVARVLVRQSVAEHSFFVASYSCWIAKALGIVDMAAVLEYAIFHDASEQFTSDIPGPVKRALGGSDSFTTYEKAGLVARFGGLVGGVELAPDLLAIVKAADVLDEVAYLCGESRLGNSTVAGLSLLSYTRLKLHWQQVMPLFYAPDLLDAVWDEVVLRVITAEKDALSQPPA